MWYIAGIIIIGLTVLLSCNFKTTQRNDDTGGSNTKISTMLINPSDTIKPIYSVKDIQAKLKVLSKTDPPDDLAFGAMCYEMVGPPNKAIYICPVCGEKTLYKLNDDYTNQQNMDIIQNGITACRNEIKNIEGIHISLDESQFCKHCNPGIEEPQLCLLVNIDNEKDTTKVCDINYLDIKLIEEFLNDEKKHKGFFDEESALADHIDRIQELLGVHLK